MASITFAVDRQLAERIDEFPWVNWSEIARHDLLKKEKALSLLDNYDPESDRWAVEIGRKAKKEQFKRMLRQLTKAEKKDILGR